MTIYLEISQWLKKFTSGVCEIKLEVEEGANALDAILLSGVPEEEVGIISVLESRGPDNWVLADRNYPLKPDDKLKVYSPIIGG